MKRASHHKSIAQLLSKERSLTRYFKISRGFNYLGQLVAEQLPEGIREQVSVRYYREGELCLNVTSAAVGMRIKMQAPNMIVNLAGERAFDKLTRITTKVQPETYKKSTKKRPVFRLSEENRQLMESLAGATKDEGLKQTFLKLANHHDSGRE